MTNVVKLDPPSIGVGFRFDAQQILADASREDFSTLVIIGDSPDGTIFISGTANVGETLLLLERAKLQLVQGE